MLSSNCLKSLIDKKNRIEFENPDQYGQLIRCCCCYFLVGFLFGAFVNFVRSFLLLAGAPHTSTSSWRMVVIKKTILPIQISRLAISRQLVIVVRERTDELLMNPAVRNNRNNVALLRLLFFFKDYYSPTIRRQQQKKKSPSFVIPSWFIMLFIQRTTLATTVSVSINWFVSLLLARVSINTVDHHLWNISIRSIQV